MQFVELANHMSTIVKTESNLRPIQDFIANFELYYEQIALLLCYFMPSIGQVIQAIDLSNRRNSKMKTSGKLIIF